MIRNIDCWEVLKSEKLYTAWETVNSVRCLQTGRHRDQKNTHQMELNEVSDIQKAVNIFHCQRYAFRSISKEKQKMNEISGRVKNEITVFGTLLSETSSLIGVDYSSTCFVFGDCCSGKHERFLHSVACSIYLPFVICNR